MLVNDLVIKARRVLGDIKAQRWSNERMLDIVNDGLVDINRYTGAYRAEHFFELQSYRYRYPLPTDMLQLTSAKYNGDFIHLYNQSDKVKGLYATKDQLNVGVLELKNLPPISLRAKRLLGGPTGFIVPQPAFDLWKNSYWNNTSSWRDDQLWGTQYLIGDDLYGVAVNPLLNPNGVTTGAVVPSSVFDNLKPKVTGLLSDVHKVGTNATVSVAGDAFGVLTAFNSNATSTLDSGGSIGDMSGVPYRIAGRYGTVTSVLKSDEFIQVRYKAIPQVLTSLEVAFPLSIPWISVMVNWIVGTALQDDNDANNAQRALVFLGRYERDLKAELASSNKDYSSASKKYDTKYNGGIK